MEMHLVRQGAQMAAFFAVPIAILVSYAVVTDPRRQDDYDPIKEITIESSRSGSLQGDFEDSSHFLYLVRNFERFKPQLRNRLLTVNREQHLTPAHIEREVAFDACRRAGRQGVEFLMVLSTIAEPEARLELIRNIGLVLYPLDGSPLQKDVFSFLELVERENTVEGDLAFCALASSGKKLDSGSTREERAMRFRAKGMEPFSNASDFPNFKNPLSK